MFIIEQWTHLGADCREFSSASEFLEENQSQDDCDEKGAADDQELHPRLFFLLVGRAGAADEFREAADR